MAPGNWLPVEQFENDPFNEWPEPNTERYETEYHRPAPPDRRRMYRELAKEKQVEFESQHGPVRIIMKDGKRL
jgi:hypothetical protein